jgi:hypothetical protein
VLDDQFDRWVRNRRLTEFTPALAHRVVFVRTRLHGLVSP